MIYMRAIDYRYYIRLTLQVLNYFNLIFVKFIFIAIFMKCKCLTMVIYSVGLFIDIKDFYVLQNLILSMF